MMDDNEISKNFEFMVNALVANGDLDLESPDVENLLPHEFDELVADLWRTTNSPLKDLAKEVKLALKEEDESR